MYKKLFQWMVLMITVLSVNLLTGFITNAIVHYNIGINPYKFTVLAMLALVFILAPAYKYLGERLELLVARMLLSGSNSFGKTMGLLFSFGLIFCILFAIYLNQWFDINILTVFEKSLRSSAS